MFDVACASLEIQLSPFSIVANTCSLAGQLRRGSARVSCVKVMQYSCISYIVIDILAIV